MFISRRKKASADGGVGCKAQRRARVEGAGAAELSAVEAADALKPAVLEQQLEQATTTSPMASSEAVPLCAATGNAALATGEQWLLPLLHSSSGVWLKPCPWLETELS